MKTQNQPRKLRYEGGITAPFVLAAVILGAITTAALFFGV